MLVKLLKEMISRGGNIYNTWLLCFTTELDITIEYDSLKWEQ